MNIPSTYVQNLTVLFLVMIAVSAGCTMTAAPPAAQTSGPADSDQSVIITETTGKITVLPHPASRIITQNGDVAELLIAFGAKDTIVGVSDTIKNRPDIAGHIGDVPSIGDWQNPSIERITSLRPDVLVTYGTMVKNTDQIKAANITMIQLDCYRIPKLASDARAIGNLTGKTDRAEEYAQFMEGSLSLIESRLNSTDSEYPLMVYTEGYSDYTAHGRESGGTLLLTLLRAKNIGANLPGLSQKVSPEWIIVEDPDVILKIGSREDMKSESLDDIRTRIMNRPGFDRIQAVREGRVYVINGDLISSPRAVAGVLYAAKALYPDQFADIDPDQVLHEYATRFFSGADNIPSIAPSLNKGAGHA
ncbi:MAG: ABC transporter substrate-binding protein [Methanoregula sp.]|nr:ABC transporter substrate-binding protein [Methanoregula sp.]